LLRPVTEGDLTVLDRFLIDPDATGTFRWHGWRDPGRWRRAWAENGLLTSFHSDDAKGSAGAAVLERVVRNVEAGIYRPNVDRVYPLDDVAAAHRYMEDNQATGKVVILPLSPS
jgi:NADPH:quinone reductase-like Zn-dependent oxidoreductase